MGNTKTRPSTSSSISEASDDLAEALDTSECLQIGPELSKTDGRDVNFDKLEETLGYKFRSRKLLVQAVTHPSVQSSESYQRLEFLGDAVLGHLVTMYYFNKYKDLPQGHLTDLKQATVCNENFARIAVKYRLHEHLQHTVRDFQARIDLFTENIKTELDTPGLNAFGLGDVKAPKVLADIVESIAGAVFLDSGLVTEEVWRVFEPLLQPLATPDTVPKQPIRELQERCQQRGDDLRYSSYQSDPLNFTVYVFVNEELISTVATKSCNKHAEKLAARQALIKLKERDDNLVATAEEDDSKVISGDPKADTDMAAAVNQQQSCSAKASQKRNDKQILYELCNSKKWKSEYKRVLEEGPAHAKKYTYSVRVRRDQEWSEEYVGEPMPKVTKAENSAAATFLRTAKFS
ncbi:hypothetical protein R1sor_000993 [Riccia sorocarpa]|uniref:Uncharacterized protein n=1 Tax=Riccia sorocarpa TaxID=122646 RepID=A0ABD3GWD9_9MARC